MTPTEAKARLTEVEAALVTANQRLELQRSIRKDLTAKLEALPRNGDCPEGDKLKTALGQVLHGVTRMDGVDFPELNALLDKPGIPDTERLIARFLNEQSALKVFLERWARKVTLPYRFIGKPFKATFEGRELQPGDICELTVEQSVAWADRFEPAESSSLTPRKAADLPDQGPSGASADPLTAATWGRSSG